MPSTWSQVLFHFVFSTKLRAPTINPDIQPRLYPFIGGIVRDLGGSLWAVGGMPDHVHLLVRWKTDPSIADLMRDVKHRSSQWIHEEFPGGRPFEWQKGYGVFSVSRSKSDEVKHYLEHQVEHHRTMDFRSKLIALLRLHDVEFDEQYLD